MAAYQKIGIWRKVTIIGIGPVVLNALEAIVAAGDKSVADLFVVSELPFADLSAELKDSLKKTKNVIIIEEHAKRGGLGEFLAIKMMEEGLACALDHYFAVGYPGGVYGSQKYHQKICGLDCASIAKLIVKYGKE